MELGEVMVVVVAEAVVEEAEARARASVKPISAISSRISSVSLAMGCCEPMQATGGSVRGILLNE